MYLLVVYDVKVDRVNRLFKFLRLYLSWVQNSVFEGEVSKSQFFEVCEGIKRIINCKEDSVLVYCFSDVRLVKRKVIGVERGDTNRLI